MIEFTDTYVTPALLHLGDWSLRWGAVIALLGINLALWRPRRIATRLLLYRLVFVGGLLLPLLPHAWGPAWPAAPPAIDQPMPPPPPEPIQAIHVPVPPASGHEVITAEVREEPVRAAAPAAGLGIRRGLLLTGALVWLAGATLLLGRLALGWLWLARLRRTAEPAGTAALAMLNECRRELRVRRAARLLTHAAVRGPVLLGGLRPAILLPPDWEEVPQASRRAALLHELTHLARRDDWMVIAEELVRACFFFHPLVHWLLNRLDGERERLCDAAVVRHGVPPQQLARVLLEFAGRLGPGRAALAPAALPFFNRITLRERIHQLLEDDLMCWITPLSRGRRLTCAAVVLGLMAALGSFGLQAGAPGEKTQAPGADGVVSGVVKDGDGRPVVGATLVLGSHKGTSKKQTVQTAADGSFAFLDWPAHEVDDDSFDLMAGKAGFTPARQFASLHNPADRNHGMVLTLHYAGECNGQVRDRAGKPVAGARVEFGWVERITNGMSWGYLPVEVLPGTPLETLYLARTDAKGRFHFATVPPGKALLFRVKAEGMAMLDTAARGLPPEYIARPGAPDVELTLDAEARIQGRVVSRVGGVKVGGLHVWLQPADHHNNMLGARVRTDAEGRFQLKGLPEGAFNVHLDAPPPEASWTVRSAPTVKLQPGDAADVEIELIEGVVVEGKVVVAGTDQPAADIYVGVYGPARPPTSAAIYGARTDRTGRYKFRLAPGETKFYISGLSPGFARAPEGEKHVVIPADVKTFTGPTLTVQRATGLSGRIIDARGQAVAQAEIIGLCRAGVCVRVNGPKVVSDANGRFHLDQGADGAFPVGEAAALQVALPGGQVYEVSTVAAQGEVEVRLPTVADAAVKGPADVKVDELAGVVVDEQGQPLDGVHVQIWEGSDRPEYQVRTGKDGIFRIGKCARDQKVWVRFRKPGYSPVMFMEQPVGVKNLVVAMDRKTYFEGVVQDPDGRPVPGALLRADQGPKRADGGIITSIWSETRADTAGRYRLYVQPDSYTFMVKAPGLGVARVPKTAIAHGQAKPLDIRLQPGVTFRAVTVDAQTGQPVAGVRLWHWQHKDVEGRSDARGAVAIPEMFPGHFDFQVEAAGYTRWWSDDAVSEWSRRMIDDARSGWQRNFDSLDFNLQPGVAPVKIVVEKGVRITGVVMDPTGKPAAGATVAPARTGSGNSLTGDTRFSVETRADGTFESLLPASGKARYNLVAHDGKYGQWRHWANGVLPPIQTTPGQEIKGVILTLTKGATVRGKVVDAQGRPVARREVRAHAADKLENRYYDPTTRTKEDGTFELRFIRPGEHFLQAAPFWLSAEEAPAGSSQKLRLAEGEQASDVNLVAVEQPR